MYYHVLQRVIPFALTFGLSVALIAAFSAPRAEEGPRQTQWGIGSAIGTGVGLPKLPPSEAVGANSPLRVTYQPKAAYTEEARTNNVQGSVRLKITLLASGTVGTITPVTELPYGLTEMAIAAARKIEFEPKRVNGVPVSVVMTREYTFAIY